MAERQRRVSEPLPLLIAIAAAMFAIVGFAMVRGHADWTDVLLSAGYAAVGSIAVAGIERRLRERSRRP
ncbi:hypothetical protein [Planctomonas psychrotolerans]|uniref:hypothetical protein n=1 Tax=Planctomonas psychrotolerans TaxID=2528712 RepID=UPI00123C3829|nr:hypothetical protein [Planctomonas psychrotolerans]